MTMLGTCSYCFASTEQATARTILVAERARKAGHNPTCPIVAVPEYLRPSIGLRARCWDSKCTQPELHMPVAVLPLLKEEDSNSRDHYFDIRSSQQPTKFTISEIIHQMVQAEWALRCEATYLGR